MGLRVVRYRSIIILVINKSDSDFVFTRMVTDPMGLHSVLSPLLINTANFAPRQVKGIKKKITAKGEGAMAGTLALLKYCLPYVSQDSLVDNFEAFFHSVFQPVFRILSSRTLSFPGGPVAREALCYSYVDLITALCRKLGRDLARDLMTAPLQQFFSCFELVHLKAKELRLGEVAFIGVTDEELVTPQAEQNSAEGKEQAIVGESYTTFFFFWQKHSESDIPG